MLLAFMAKAKTFEFEISEIDQYVIDKARELRVKKGMSQLDLSISMNLAEGTIAKIENPTQTAKYNIRHINLLSKALGCSPKDFFPEHALANDVVRLKIRVIKNTSNAKGQPNYEVLKKLPVEGKGKKSER
jgi:transcriptional regulator with XRE-family HTH domain